MHDRQVKALVNAESATDRFFAKEEQAHNLCQIGNIGLALEVVVKWIKEKNTSQIIALYIFPLRFKMQVNLAVEAAPSLLGKVPSI